MAKLNGFRNYWVLAPIFIDGKAFGFVASKIGLEPNIPDAASRAQLIHRKLQGIVDREG